MTYDPRGREITRRLSAHPLASILPLLGQQALDELANDIRDNGLLHPLVLLDGKILDGRNRYAACRAAGVRPRCVHLDQVAPDVHPALYVASANLQRRHLTTQQRALVGARLAEELCRLRQGAETGSAGMTVGDKVATVPAGVRTRDLAAEEAGVSSRMIGDALAVRREGVPELVKLVESDAVPLYIAAKVARSTDVPEQQALAAKGPQAVRQHYAELMNPTTPEPARAPAAPTEPDPFGVGTGRDEDPRQAEAPWSPPVEDEDEAEEDEAKTTKRRAHDFYPTPHWCIDMIAELGPKMPDHGLVEPCVGGCDLVDAYGVDRFVLGVDIRDEVSEACERRGLPVIVDSILDVTPERMPDGVTGFVSNPPFSLAEQVIQHLRSKWPELPVLMLLRAGFFESESRNAWLRRDTPDVYVLANRPSFTGSGTDGTVYAWFYWQGGRRRDAGTLRLLPWIHHSIRGAGRFNRKPTAEAEAAPTADA